MNQTNEKTTYSKSSPREIMQFILKMICSVTRTNMTDSDCECNSIVHTSSTMFISPKV